MKPNASKLGRTMYSDHYILTSKLCIKITYIRQFSINLKPNKILNLVTETETYKYSSNRTLSYEFKP